MKELSTPWIDAARLAQEDYRAEIDALIATPAPLDCSDWTDEEIGAFLDYGVVPEDK